MDLADIREYVPGDDVRHIDWNVTARMDTPYVREYHEDREITAQFLLDVSPSVDFGTARALKRDLLIDFVAVLARLLTRHGNRVGAILYGKHVERVVPANGGREPGFLPAVSGGCPSRVMRSCCPAHHTVFRWVSTSLGMPSGRSIRL